MPQMGESIAEGTLSKWLKKVGDEVKRDEPIFEISTDKVDAEIPATESGVLAEILVKEGQTVPVQAVVARLETEKGAAVAPPSPATLETPAAKATASGKDAESVLPAAKETQRSSKADAEFASGVPPRGPGSNGGTEHDRLREKSSPLVRKIAAEHGIALAGLRGSGIAGRVTKRDIMDLVETGTSAQGAPASMYAPGGTEAAGPGPEPWQGDAVEPMTKIRRLTSDHMVAA